MTSLIFLWTSWRMKNKKISARSSIKIKNQWCVFNPFLRGVKIASATVMALLAENLFVLFFSEHSTSWRPVQNRGEFSEGAGKTRPEGDKGKFACMLDEKCSSLNISNALVDADFEWLYFACAKMLFVAFWPDNFYSQRKRARVEAR